MLKALCSPQFVKSWHWQLVRIRFFHVELQESGRLWQLLVEFYFIHNIEIPTMDALQFIEFEIPFEPIDKKITNINIMNERKNSS